MIIVIICPNSQVLGSGRRSESSGDKDKENVQDGNPIYTSPKTPTVKATMCTKFFQTTLFWILNTWQLPNGSDLWVALPSLDNNIYINPPS